MSKRSGGYGWPRPFALEDVLREEADATGAEAHGGGGEAVNIFSMQEGGLKLLCGEQGGRCAIQLRQQAHLADRRLLRAFTLATQLKSGDHVLAQWGHPMSPFVT